nr:hypothetical protein [Microbacterium sp. SD291]
MGQFSHCRHGWGVFGLEHNLSFLRIIRLIDDVDADAREHRLVEEALGVLGDRAVEVAGFAHEAYDRVDVFAHEQRVGFGGADDPFRCGNLGGNLILSWSDVFGSDDTVKVSIDEPLLLRLEGAQALALCPGELLGLGALGIKDAVRSSACDGCLFRGELHTGVPFALHGVLDVFDRDVRQVAGGAAGVPAEAEEVAVDAATTSGVSVAHASAATVAEQPPFEGVVVLPCPVSGQASARE